MNEQTNFDAAEPVLETETPSTPFDAVQTPEPEQAEVKTAKKGYQNLTARMLNTVFLILLVVMGVFLILQIYLNVAGYLQQGASFGIALLYTLASVSTPFMLCAIPFMFRFFAEVVELMDHRS